MKTNPLFLYLTLGSLTASAFSQGNLTPPAGAPAPTMKSLDQIASTGTAINATNTPGDANYHFIISSPGSYYLTGNLGVTNANGIHVTAPDVTIELNGFQISRSSGAGGDGITIDPAAHRSVVKNGSIRGFVNGVQCPTEGPLLAQSGGGAFLQLTVSGCSIGVAAGTNWQVDGCRAHDNGFAGIFASGGMITNCVASNNQGRGIYLGNGTISHCVANENQNGGIFASSGATLTNCSADHNTGPYAGIYGIFAGPGSTLTGCTAQFNSVANGAGGGIFADNRSTIKDCSAQLNGGYGIRTGTGCTIVACTSSESGNGGGVGVGINAGNDSAVSSCTVMANKGDGIQLGQRCKISDCNVNGNGNGATGSGITGDIRTVVRHCSAEENRKSGVVVLGESVVVENRASHNGLGVTAAGIDTSGGSGSRVEANHARDNNGTGILTSAGDVVMRNTAGANTVNFSPSSGVNFAPVQTPNGATSPLANIIF
jgi:parallel beta-helix repeat protein